MATYEYELDKIPKDPRSKQLWLQHAAGLIYFEDAREYAISRIDESIDKETKEKVIEGINDAIYGVMMILDGVSGQIENSKYAVNLTTKVNLVQKSDKEDKVLEEVDLLHGDGMCMGFHGWLEGDFGEVKYPNSWQILHGHQNLAGRPLKPGVIHL